MVFYTCPRCSYNTSHKTKYVIHLKKKKLCKPVLSNTNLQNEYIKYNIIEKLIFSSKNVELPQNSTFSNKCKYCDKILSRSDSLARHYKNCKEKIKSDNNMKELERLLNELKLELEKKDQQINELIKKVGIQNSGTIIQNIQNNIKLLAYNESDISDLPEKDFKRFFNYNMTCVPLMKRIHFNLKS
jgi:hypothetical protein